MGSSSPLSPTFYGHIASTQDALILFEACLSGAVNHVARRPHDRERTSLIKSGNVFIYEEHSSGIKRWTDGVPWSPSRILGNFLVYRELERPFPPGEKKRAMKRSKRSPGIGKVPEPYGGMDALNNGYSAASATSSSYDSPNSNNSLTKETERSLIGSLVDSYGFKEEGLVKKTVSVTVGGVSYHLVSYYTVGDVMNNKFNTPTKDPRFQDIAPRPDLITKQNFRTPIDEVDSLDRAEDRSVYSGYSYGRPGYEMTNRSMSHRPMSLPTPPVSYTHNPSIYHNYGMNANPGTYSESFATANSQNNYNSQWPPAPGIYPAPKVENQNVGGYRQQRYSSVVGVSSKPNRSHVASAGPSFQRRASTLDQACSVDSAISGISSASANSKLSNDSGYSSQGFYPNLRDATNTQQDYPNQRSLPTPAHQTGYERPPSNSYGGMDNPATKENIWLMGNSSTGHAHYVAPQLQWASTGTS
jgi:hypothetical protein